MINQLAQFNKGELKMLLSVVFSFRNESLNLPTLLDRLERVLSGLPDLDYEIIFVNDLSSDNSMEILLDRRRNNPKIKIVNMSRRFGITPCVLAGFEASRGEAVIYMDADLQDPPELIPELLAKYQSGVDVVHTVRTKRKGEAPAKIFVTIMAYRVINFFSNIELRENAGDFKLLSRRVVNEILRLSEYDPFMRGLSVWVGFPQDFVYYERDAKFSGKTQFPLFRSLNPGKELLRGITSYSSMPLYFALILGISVSFSAFCYLIYIVISRLFFDMHLPGWPAMMATMLFLGGVILFTIGILGVYIGKIFDNVQGRPRYIIADKIGFDE